MKTIRPLTLALGLALAAAMAHAGTPGAEAGADELAQVFRSDSTAYDEAVDDGTCACGRHST